MSVREKWLSRGKSRLMSVLSGLGIAVLLATTLSAVTPPTSASALDGKDFNAGYIISDYAFYNGAAMTQLEIQNFLAQMIGGCQNGKCLNTVRTNTFDRPADRTVCAAYDGLPNELASVIIFKVQQACGISAKVLLVTLQKEQSLVTDKAPTDSRLGRAMGYACPDNNGGVCAAEYYGLYNQIYMAAWQFKRYSTPDRWGNYQPGVEEILYHPRGKTECGSKIVTIKNNATAALYNYTPYTPNQAALDNLGDVGDDCSSYGNRNFWDYYTSWFGSPTIFVPPDTTTSRLYGSSRYTTSTAISKAAYPTTAPVVFVTSGADYPDGLAASPAAAVAGGPLLLTMPTSLPANVKAEIVRLGPAKIVVVGGTGVVSAAVYNQLAALAPAIERAAGGNRYATARAVAALAFPAGATTAYIASGENFPDALTASAAAGANDAPVILVPGSDTSLDPATADLLTQLGVTSVVIAGGTGVVSQGIQNGLAALPGVTVTRLGGGNRFTTAQLINEHAFDTAEIAYIASAWDFPDALSAAAAAGAQGAPLYLTRGVCTPTDAIQHLVDLGVNRVYMVGGPAVIPAAAYGYATCG
jgi:putative cell wall-binding protein